MTWKDGVESYFRTDDQKHLGASTANIKLSCLPRTNKECHLLKHATNDTFCCPWKQMSNKFTFSVTRHVQIRENLLISLNVPMFWFDFLLLITGVMYKTIWKLAMFTFRMLRILSGHHIDHV